MRKSLPRTGWKDGQRMTPETSAAPVNGAAGPPEFTPVGPRAQSLPKNAWRKEFLRAYRQLGNKDDACTEIHISYRRLQRELARNARFAAAVERAHERYVAKLERHMDGMFLENKRGNVIAGIFRLKALKPSMYVERHQIVTANVNVFATAEEAQGLLSAMLHSAAPSTLESLPAQPAPRALQAYTKKDDDE